MRGEPLTEAELSILREFGHPCEPDGNEVYLARRVLQFPDTGSDNWWIAAAITLAAAYLRGRVSAQDPSQ